MKKLLMMVCSIIAFMFILIGCQRSDGSTISGNHPNLQESLHFSKTIKVYDSTGKYWVNMKLSSNTLDGIEQMIAMKPYVKVYSKENPVVNNLSGNVNSQNNTDNLNTQNPPLEEDDSPVLSIEIEDTNIPKSMVMETGYGATKEELDLYFQKKN